jgi:hypothetical protein
MHGEMNPDLADQKDTTVPKSNPSSPVVPASRAFIGTVLFRPWANLPFGVGGRSHEINGANRPRRQLCLV